MIDFLVFICLGFDNSWWEELLEGMVCLVKADELLQGYEMGYFVKVFFVEIFVYFFYF